MNHMLIQNNFLDPLQFSCVKQLSEVCRAKDGSTPSLYPHILQQKRSSDSNFLFFKEDRLVGFLSVFFFYPQACEVSVLVDPVHRRQGISRKLIQASLPLLIAKQMEMLIFSTPTFIDNSWLEKMGFQYKNSEYQMYRNSYEPILLAKQSLDIQKASLLDIEQLCKIDRVCFANVHHEMTNRFVHLIEDNNYTLFLAYLQGKPIGKAHIHWQEDNAIVSDIAIIPDYQRQGFGNELLVHCINHALTLGKTKLTLDVETSNEKALKLYLQNGFKTVNSADYWEIHLETLRGLF